EQPVELALRAARERAGRTARRRAAPQRAVPGGDAAEHDPAAAALEVDVLLRARRPRVRGRPEPADQPHLLDRGRELGAGDAPLDPLQLVESLLDAAPLPAGVKVGAQPRLQVAGLAHVQHLPAAVEEVDAGTGRHALEQPPRSVYA